MKKWQTFTSRQKFKSIFLILAVLIFIYLLTLDFNLSNYIFYLLFIVTIYPTQSTYYHRRQKEIKRLWALADELDITEGKLSQVTGLGTIDLTSSRYEGDGAYIPPRKAILKGITYLESIKEINNKTQKA